MSVAYGPVGAVVGEIRGVEVRLASVYVEDGGLHVLLRGTSSPETERMNAEFEAQLTHWGEVWSRGGAAAAGEAPDMPGNCLSEFKVQPMDAGGSEYPPMRMALAGTGTEWDGWWTFSCAGPPLAHLEIAVSRLDRPGVVTIEVSDQSDGRAILEP